MYCEYQPDPSVAPFIECFWTSDIEQAEQRRILPDGCVDLLFFSRRHQLIDAQVVGVMTRAHMVDLRAGESVLGIRFHPGMAGVCLGFDVPKLNDQSVVIESVLGNVGAEFREAVSRNRRRESMMADLAEVIFRLPRGRLMREAVGELTGRVASATAGDLLDVDGLSERQIRRTCLRHSGLSPKKLSRVLRFRRAVQRLRSQEHNLSQVALDCGYFDQSHMNRDFREFAGLSPAFFLTAR